MDEIEEVRGHLGFVRLQVADKMPGNLMAQRFDFSLRFLHVVFPQDFRPGLDGLAYAFRIHGFAYGHEADTLGSRPERRAAASIRSRTRAKFSAISPIFSFSDAFSRRNFALQPGANKAKL